MGSGTTNFVSKRMKRNSVGIEIVPEYYEMVKKEIEPVELILLEQKNNYARTEHTGRIALR
jgi:DNA modification methylase